MSKRTIYTIGHSNRTIEQFLRLLDAHHIQEVVDVRTIPASRHNPQFGQQALKGSLKRAHVKYRHIKRLGGFRHARKDSKNVGWHNLSFRGYADYMATSGFSQGLATLEKIGAGHTTAVLCAEAVPFRCHRSLIADALVKRGWRVLHIQSVRTASPHRLTPFLRIRKGQLTYPETAGDSSGK